MLKTLEEPPSYVIFILATTESQDSDHDYVPLSEVRLSTGISIETISDRLMDLLQQEGVEAEKQSVMWQKPETVPCEMGKSAESVYRFFYLGEPLTYDHVLEGAWRGGY